ncbi:hypothetical protein SAMN06265368_3067 [Cohaesibacter gelatinilyticus]|uniref:Uncharacterized protein n=1 Tax=Cohaesibacter gelatinilyticus TaxID=372072 RepID=A0A285PJC4_9HYPH|nr:hypothetical protein SAMN06265368_3067 [Cohaesibacter gelatinilyticus]
MTEFALCKFAENALKLPAIQLFVAIWVMNSMLRGTNRTFRPDFPGVTRYDRS